MKGSRPLMVRVGVWLVAVWALLVVGRTGLGAPFALLVMDSDGGSGSLGFPLSASKGALYRSKSADPMGTPPTEEQIAEEPLLEFTSYAAMGGEPSGTGSRANPAAFIVNGPPFWRVNQDGHALMMSGIRGAFAVPAVDPMANPFGSAVAQSRPGPLGADSVFVARLTVQRGAKIMGARVFLGAKFAGRAEPVAVLATLNGGSKLSPIYKGDPTGSTKSLLLRSHLAAQVDLPGFGAADVHDVYVVSQAAPPAMKPAKASSKPKTKTARILKLKSGTRSVLVPEGPEVIAAPEPIVDGPQQLHGTGSSVRSEATPRTSADLLKRLAGP